MKEFECKYKSTERLGLYILVLILVIIAVLNSCEVKEKASRILGLLQQNQSIGESITGADIAK